MPAPSDVGDVHGQCAHALDVGAHVERADDLSQVARHRLLQRQQFERLFFGHPLLGSDVLMVCDDLFGQGQIRFQQGVRRVLHRVCGQATHLAQSRAERRQLLLVCRTHGHTSLRRNPCGPS